MTKFATFLNVSCSQCGKEFGPGDHGFSHCDQHQPPEVWIAELIRAEYDQAPRDYRASDNWDDGADDIAKKITERFDAKIKAAVAAERDRCSDLCDEAVEKYADQYATMFMTLGDLINNPVE